MDITQEVPIESWKYPPDNVVNENNFSGRSSNEHVKKKAHENGGGSTLWEDAKDNWTLV